MDEERAREMVCDMRAALSAAMRALCVPATDWDAVMQALRGVAAACEAVIDGIRETGAGREAR